MYEYDSELFLWRRDDLIKCLLELEGVEVLMLVFYMLYDIDE